MSLLETKNVTKRFGGLTAVSDVDLSVHERSIVSIIGPNGAGKTTLFNCITGFYDADEGSITFQGNDIDGLRPDQITELGMSRTYQNIRLFSDMTTIENIMVGEHRLLENKFVRKVQDFSEELLSSILAQNLHLWYGAMGIIIILSNLAFQNPNRFTRILLIVWAIPITLFLLYTVFDLAVEAILAILYFPVKDLEEQAKEEAWELLELVGMEGKANIMAKNLPYGDQRRLEIARALGNQPSLLLLDEPTAGMNPNETQIMTNFIRSLRDEFNLTIILIEHDMRVVMGISDHVIVLDHGVKIAEGTPEVVQQDPAVIAAYLGQPLGKVG